MKIKTISKIVFSFFLIIFCASLVMPIIANGAALNSTDILNTSDIAKSGLQTQNTSLQTIIMNIINIVLGFLGIIAIIIVIIGGFKWMTSGKKKKKTTDARKLIIAGLVGLIIILIAYTIVNFVLTTTLDTTNGIMKK
ncbi:hypothetical protein HY750_01530 [Candidatus Kuenenbacteria bacterium]|nr:hypothetical protein [Candidatus Kuenenbacteria bacterium]